MHNLYKILGANKNATDAEITAAYRKKARQYHPDKGGYNQKMQQLNEAYATLSDPVERKNLIRNGNLHLKTPTINPQAVCQQRVLHFQKPSKNNMNSFTINAIKILLKETRSPLHF